jgi:branched-chain amino acid transport system ATP-binding protein
VNSNSQLEILDLHLRYGTSHVLHGVDLAIGPRVTAVLGRNGMGKTSLCTAIMGLHKHFKGQLRLDGTDISQLAPEARAQLGIGYVPQGRRVFRSLSVDEHLRIVEKPGGAWSIDRIYDTFPRLKARRVNLGDRLSGGEQQMLAISRALLLNPRFLILDEPTEGLAPAIVADVVELIKNVSSEGVNVLLVEQNLHAALEAADDVAIMVGGEIVGRMSSDELAKDPALQRRHLGLEPGQEIEVEEV